MIDIHDYDIQCIEHEILWKYDKSPCDYPDCDCLLSLRKDMINKRVLSIRKKSSQTSSHSMMGWLPLYGNYMTGRIVSGTASKTMRISRMQRLRLNAILVTTTRNFIPFKLRTGRIYGMLSVTLVGIGYTMMVCRWQDSLLISSKGREKRVR